MHREPLYTPESPLRASTLDESFNAAEPHAVTEAPRLLEGLRILIVVGPMVLGGAERQAIMLARQLRERHGAHVEFWGIYGDGGQLVDELDRYEIPWRIVHGPVIGARAPWRWRARQVKLLLSFTRSLRSEHFNVMLPFMTLPNTVLSLVWRLTSARVCIWNQRSDGSDADELNITYSARLAARLATAFVSNSVVGADYLRRRFDIAGERLHVVHNGVRLAPPERERTEWRAELGADEETLVATMIANLHPPKDHATLLRAWRIVADRLSPSGRRAILALAGRPVSTHSSLEELATELGITDCVRFLGAVRDVNGLLHSSDLAVFSSLSEGMPNGVLEGMAAGLPVVATALPGIRDALGVDDDRLLAPIGDVAGLAERILALCDSAQLRASLGASNRRRIETEFAESVMVDRFAALIEYYWKQA